MHDLVAGTRSGVLFTDDVRCPVHVADLAAARRGAFTMWQGPTP
ncbi:hypothetical protein SCA03_24640 [Streptomyces cacaoi]|uniref:Uncharacterized protein n=1 Tax=Streptomyces cacaoi TaxID=1898 RepID=A0A4Y3QZA2_STRCI|nr:hypothetical protein SCA03_24640 [Streptomyces cacaoi]